VRLSYNDKNNDGDIDVTPNLNTNELVEESNYYPFGLKHKGYNDVFNFAIGNPSAQKFGYNGVELEESLGLNLHEMDFRLYDPAIGRFNGIDPVTHHSFGTSVAFDNNPIFWADPSGADAYSASSGGADWSGMDLGPSAAESNAMEHAKSQFGSASSSSDNSQSGGNCCNGFTNALADLEQFNPTGLSEKYNITKKIEYNYGGDRSGSFMDYFHKFVNFTDSFNPIAIAWNTISFTYTGADRLGNKQTVTEATINAVSIIPIFKIGKFANGSKISFNFYGGPTFNQYKAAYWSKNLKPGVEYIVGPNGKVFKNYMELHHRFIPQRWKWAPNWLLNNKYNLQPLRSLEHGLVDKYRYQFFPIWLKKMYPK
jgi:RHS repeat-associated protein